MLQSSDCFVAHARKNAATITDTTDTKLYLIRFGVFDSLAVWLAQCVFYLSF